MRGKVVVERDELYLTLLSFSFFVCPFFTVFLTISLISLSQECQILLTHGPRSLYFASPYVDVYGESQHQYRGKPLYLEPRRYEAIVRLYNSHLIPREVVSKRSNATRIIINNYY